MMNKEKFQNVQQIVEEIRDNYYELYDKYGIRPNVILLSRDVLSKLVQEHVIGKTINSEFYITQIVGVNVQVVEGTNVIKAAIILED